MIEGNSGFAYKRAIQYAKANSGWGHIDGDDILQAAFEGLVIAVDRYDPEKAKDGKLLAFTTFAHFWILKYVNEEVWQRHWNTMRPPRAAMRSFLYKKMDYDRSGEYVEQFMFRGGDRLLEPGNAEDGYIQTDILNAVEQSGLSTKERRIFDSLYGENEEQDDLGDLTTVEIDRIEESMLVKLREQFE